MFLSLDLLSEYRIQHGVIGPLYVTSSYSTWIFCRGVSGFATDCPCDVWCRGLTTCLLHVGPPFGNRFLNTNWAVGLTYWVVYLHFYDICNYICLDTSYHFWLYLYFLNILYFFNYSYTNIFHIRSLCTFYYFWKTATQMESVCIFHGVHCSNAWWRHDKETLSLLRHNICLNLIYNILTTLRLQCILENVWGIQMAYNAITSLRQHAIQCVFEFVIS